MAVYVFMNDTGCISEFGRYTGTRRARFDSENERIFCLRYDAFITFAMDDHNMEVDLKIVQIQVQVFFLQDGMFAYIFTCLPLERLYVGEYANWSRSQRFCIAKTKKHG